MQPPIGNSNVVWIPPSQGGDSSNPNVNMNSTSGSNTIGFASGHETVQSMFSSTKCYDLIGPSNKVIIFETSISFQQAFVALAEHGNIKLIFI